jgi:hypothetical protein
MTTIPMAMLVAVAGCAADPGDSFPDGGDAPAGSPDAQQDTVADRPADVPAPLPDAPTQTEPALMVRACGGAPGTSGPAANVDAGAGAQAICCPSALDFEDGSTGHFLPAACCRLALSAPQVAAMPTACGHGALRLTADFRATGDSALCGTPDESPDCTHTAGEVTRAVLAPLNLAGRTASVMVYLQGAALPPNPVHGTLFIVGTAGVSEGPAVPLPRTDAWVPVELPVPADPAGAGAAVQVLGIRLDFHGQAWTGQAYLDELTWR